MRIHFYLLFFLICTSIYSQNRVFGVVVNQKKEPISMVAIRTENGLKWATTNREGSFELKNITQNKIKLLFSCLGTKAEELIVDFSVKKVQEFLVVLEEDNLSLEKVVVTGHLKNRKKTSILIKRKAIEHLQASSLADVLQLVPGQLIQNQNFDNVKQALIRQKDTQDGAEDATAFGTDIRINGISISNNSNLQNASSALRGNVNYFNTTAGRGNDLRKISVDNIEKIEIIKGVPSVLYGDITSGVILIETQKGKTPLKVTQRITPKVYQTNIHKGFSFNKKSTLNMSLAYTKALQNEREKQLNYNQIDANLVYVAPLLSNKITTTTGISIGSVFDGNHKTTDIVQRRNKEKSFQFDFTAVFFTEKKWAEKLQLNLATSYQKQESLDQQIVNKPLSVLSLFTSTNEGTGTFLPQTYISRVEIEGQPLTFYGRITNEFTRKKHHLLLGLEYSYEKNLGSGVSFNPLRPPEGIGFQTLRVRPYHEVPSLKQFSFFMEDTFKFNTYHIRNKLALGIRVDNFQPKNVFKSSYGLQIAPRINFSSILYENFIVKGGWGIATKAPSLLFLYPDKAFFDLVSLNYFTGNPKENLVLLSTHVFDTRNTGLKVAQSNKLEFGFNYLLGKNSIDLLAYKEQTTNAFGYTQKAVFMPYNIYKITQENANEYPDYELETTKNYIGLYNQPSNRFTITNKGMELLVDLKVARLLSLQLSGAYIKTATVYTDDRYKIISNPVTSQQIIGAYQKGSTNTNEQMNTTLRSVFHIPALKFIISFTTQTIWFEKQQQLAYNELPYKYAYADGSFLPFNRGDKILVDEFSRTSNIEYKNNTPIWLLNINVSKEIGKSGKLSFFVNNMFNNRPIINNRPRNIPLFYGIEGAIKL
ncbi:TonB-dependent receptor [Tenacibaculum maritimum]|uniref:TonB-dependent receptor n=1 Tax=Tenacibaculum maritimum TaxID=107401 RepID=UPI0038767BB9